MISLTENAAKEILKIMQESDLNEEVCLRVGVKGGGCSGFKYNFGFDSKSGGDDVIFGKAIIDKSSLDIISGSVVDFKKEMIGESFVIDNPKATASCGCGLSFSV